jgi:predicted RNA-binding Zn ribbon-like protein
VDFASYAQRAVDLVNSDLTKLEELISRLERRPWLAEQVVEGDLAPLRTVQAELGILVDASAAGEGAAVVGVLNQLLSRHPVRPRVSGHDETSWHLHVNDTGASAAETLTSEALLGLVLLVTEVGATRLGRCASSTCNRAFVDTSTNSSRRFCSTRCSTRENVAAFRRRRTTIA